MKKSLIQLLEKDELIKSLIDLGKLSEIRLQPIVGIRSKLKTPLVIILASAETFCNTLPLVTTSVPPILSDPMSAYPLRKALRHL